MIKISVPFIVRAQTEEKGVVGINVSARADAFSRVKIYIEETLKVLLDKNQEPLLTDENLVQK